MSYRERAQNLPCSEKAPHFASPFDLSALQTRQYRRDRSMAQMKLVRNAFHVHAMV
ncbi:hypothetical protein BN2475_440015 [Paraburkholderia ribeironis]|uniref:Uncharacterized protein n=1 Tax=Paraburkholderia ribeironis TaxID=1247936 RepID=A0A1N7S892_9BURK|nr:hypothetical protein BN2475_440015 [Paraburkholderia ribeironis]